ncbi:MAG: hypothetical protein LBF95_08985 [Treponema sp.]|jgi:hypothetical protein|nr:hypothetical protein [Treponema sp.]
MCRFPPDVPKEIWIAKGTYRPSETGDSAAYFPISSNTGYIGGFAGWETAKSQRNPAANTVTISGDLGGGSRSRRLFRYSQSDGGPAVSGDIVFEDLSFTGARGADSGDTGPGITLDTTLGGGVQGRVELKNCVFTDLEAGYRGGAVYAEGLAVEISGSRFEQCRITGAGGYGGAVYVNGGPVNITDVAVTSASAYQGGALYVADGAGRPVTMSGIRLENVSAGYASSGITISGGGNTVTISNITINKTIAVSSNTHSGIYISLWAEGTTDISDAELYNAGIYINNSSGMNYLKNSTVSNSTTFENDHIYIFGGADISDLTVDGTRIGGNASAVFISNPSYSVRPVNVSGLTVNNTKNGYGLTISNSSSQSTTMISGLTMNNTKVIIINGMGGGMFLQALEGGISSIADMLITGATASFAKGAYISSVTGFSVTNTVVNEVNREAAAPVPPIWTL